MRSRGAASRDGSRWSRGDSLDWNAERIRALRAHLRMTQEEVALRLGTRQQTISEWEVGKHRPRGTSLAMLTHLAESSGFASTYARADAVYARAGR